MSILSLLVILLLPLYLFICYRMGFIYHRHGFGAIFCVLYFLLFIPLLSPTHSLAMMQAGNIPAGAQGGLLAPQPPRNFAVVLIQQYLEYCVKVITVARDLADHYEGNSQYWSAAYEHTVANQFEARWIAARNILYAATPEQLQSAQPYFTDLVNSQAEATEALDFLKEKSRIELLGRSDSVVNRIMQSISDVVNSPTAKAAAIGTAKIVSIMVLLHLTSRCIQLSVGQ